MYFNAQWEKITNCLLDQKNLFAQQKYVLRITSDWSNWKSFGWRDRFHWEILCSEWRAKTKWRAVIASRVIPGVLEYRTSRCCRFSDREGIYRREKKRRIQYLVMRRSWCLHYCRTLTNTSEGKKGTTKWVTLKVRRQIDETMILFRFFPRTDETRKNMRHSLSTLKKIDTRQKTSSLSHTRKKRKRGKSWRWSLAWHLTMKMRMSLASISAGLVRLQQLILSDANRCTRPCRDSNESWTMSVCDWDNRQLLTCLVFVVISNHCERSSFNAKERIRPLSVFNEMIVRSRVDSCQMRRMCWKVCPWGSNSSVGMHEWTKWSSLEERKSSNKQSHALYSLAKEKRRKWPGVVYLLLAMWKSLTKKWQKVWVNWWTKVVAWAMYTFEMRQSQRRVCRMLRRVRNLCKPLFVHHHQQEQNKSYLRSAQTKL